MKLGMRVIWVAVIAVAFVGLLSIQEADAAVIDLNWEVNTHHGVTIINVGDTVKWTWTDEFTHDVRHDSPTPLFASVIVAAAGNTFQHTFTEPGTFDYLCTIHGAALMDGTILVVGPPDQITDLSLTIVSSTQVDLQWSEPFDGGSPITGYFIQSKVNEVISTLETNFGDASTTSYSDTSLSDGDVVTYRIAAINAEGQGPYSNIPASVTTGGGGGSIPDQVTDLSLTVICWCGP